MKKGTYVIIYLKEEKIDEVRILDNYSDFEDIKQATNIHDDWILLDCDGPERIAIYYEDIPYSIYSGLRRDDAVEAAAVMMAILKEKHIEEQEIQDKIDSQVEYLASFNSLGEEDEWKSEYIFKRKNGAYEGVLCPSPMPEKYFLENLDSAGFKYSNNPYKGPFFAVPADIAENNHKEKVRKFSSFDKYMES